MVYILLSVSLAIILFSAEVFTNGIEWLGKKLNLSEGCVGSLLAAVGTALPETMIPVIAILFGTGAEASHIGIGAILGAPFMLSTIAMGLAGFAAICFKFQGKKRTHMMINEGIMRRDLSFFLIVYAVALAAAFLPGGFIRIIVALGLVGAYVYYAMETLKAGECQADADLHPLIIAKKNPNPSLSLVLLQIGLALGGIVYGAHLFVDGITHLAVVLGIPAFVLSLIIAPIATELPEKFNSIIWIRQGKDTLALGNITGAMVFQSSIVPALGIALTPWELSFLALISGILALTAAGIVYYFLRTGGKIKPTTLVTVGSLYLVFIAAVIYTGGGTH